MIFTNNTMKKELVWLDFFDKLLEPTDGKVSLHPGEKSSLKLKKEYELDGTHLHPNYIPLLQTSLDLAE